MTTNAREFIDEIADVLRSKGRTVTIDESPLSFGTFVYMTSIAPNWYDRTISVSASFSTRTKRWTLGEMTIRGGSIDLTRTKRADMKTAADVYA
jgi:hypothetical protein